MKRFIFFATLTMILFCTVTNGADQHMTRFDRIKYQVGYHESRNNHNVKNGDNGLAKGLYQFHDKTFDWMKGLAGMTNLNIAREKDQETLFEWAIENGYGRHWSCIKDGRVKV
jgi:hypothetical protein